MPKSMYRLLYTIVLLCVGHVCADSASVIVPCGKCTCMARQASADCSNRNLNSIPWDLPANITYLNLARNHIQISSPIEGILCQKYPVLKKVSLAWNGLETLSQIFQGCKHLQQLNLAGNVLEFSSAMAFEDLQSLQEITSIEVQDLHKGIFDNLQRLEILNLTFYGITIEPEVFSQLSSLKRLTLILEKVLALPEHLFSFTHGNILKNLIFKGSKVKNIPDDLLDEFDSLKELHLDLPQLLELNIQKGRKPKYLQVLEISNVRSLAEDILSGLPFLKTVKLHGIGSLDGKDLFKFASTIQELEIVKCSLTELPAGWLHKMVDLETLNLSDNGLEQLNGHDFLEAKSLKHLVLSNNKISDLSNGFLDYLNGTLMQLLLNGNQLKKLEAETLTDFEMLEVLDLRQNTIRTIAATSLMNLPQLKILRLSGNYLSSLDHVMFHSFPMLREIDLAENIISEFPQTLLTSKVTYLFLSANNLQNLPGTQMCKMDVLRTLGLEDNPIVCDCSVRALHKCLPYLGVHGHCSKPTDVEGMKIAELTECLPSLITPTVSAPSLQTSSMLVSTLSGLLSPSTVTSMPLHPTPSLMSFILRVPTADLTSVSSSSAPSLMSFILRVSTADLTSVSSSSAPSLMTTPESSTLTFRVLATDQRQRTPSLALWTSSRPASIPAAAGYGPVKDLAVDNEDGDEIVRSLIATGIFETHSQLSVSSASQEILATQVNTFNSHMVSSSNVEDVTAESYIQVGNNTDLVSPNMAQVPSMLDETSTWSQAVDVSIVIIISLAVMTGTIAGIWFYRKHSQSGSYNPVHLSREISHGNMLQSLAQPAIPSQKPSNISAQTAGPQ